MIQGIKNLFSHLFDGPEFSTFSGVVDIIVVEQPDHSLKSMPFHIRFGTLKVLDNTEQLVAIRINNINIEGVFMKILPEGAAYFVIEGNKKSLRPTSEMLLKLKLKKGYNRIEFIAETALQGTQVIEGKIYLYEFTTKIVLSDIDGTITKSDVRGHISTIIGKEWTHSDIAELYTSIKKNGYKIVYLSSRPLMFYNYTHEYLQGVKQNGFSLPDGPILLSPDQIIRSLNREVVYKKADEFKGALLKDLCRVFPETINPIFAGFGNRDTDAIACSYAGLSLNSIFIINEQSVIEVVGTQKKTSYKEITSHVQEMFPKITKIKKSTSQAQSQQKPQQSQQQSIK